jgi:hypothetical protein
MVMAKIKVSQKTIDNIKKMGMTKTLESLKSIGQPGGRNVPASKEFIEGARRMYGTRVDKYLPAKSTSADAARSKAMGAKPATKAAIKTVSTKAAPKKGQSTADKLKVVGGTVAAVALAAKGGAAGRSAASKLAPGLAKSAVGKALLGTGKNTISPAMMAKYKAAAGAKPNAAKVTVGPKGSFGKTTMQQAKSGKGTPSEYASKAGQSGARATIQSRMSGPDAARASASYPKTIKSGKSTKTFGEISKNVAKATAAGGGANSGKKKLTTSASNKRK